MRKSSAFRNWNKNQLLYISSVRPKIYESGADAYLRVCSIYSGLLYFKVYQFAFVPVQIVTEHRDTFNKSYIKKSKKYASKLTHPQNKNIHETESLCSRVCHTQLSDWS